MPYIHLFKDDVPTAALPIDLKMENRSRVLRAFRYGQECTVADVSAETGISKLTVMRAIQFFCSKGILGSAGLGHSGDLGGKKPELFSFADHRHVLSIALWPLKLRLSLATITGKPVAEAVFADDLHRPLSLVLADLQNRVHGFLGEHGLLPSDLYGVVLSTSGTVDYPRGCLRYSSHSPEWGPDIPLCDSLRDIFGDQPVLLLENAGKTTGRAVLHSNRALQSCRVLTLFTSWGISACLLQNGRPLNGKDALIGEIGHMTIDPGDEERCGCGMRGCLERLVSLERLQKLLKEQLANGKASALSPDLLDFPRLFAASAEGDEIARMLVAYLARCFASALHSIALTYNPEYVVFQGDFGHADPYFDEMLKVELSAFRYYPDQGPFQTLYDGTDLFDLDARGGWFMLNEHYLSTHEIYIDD